MGITANAKVIEKNILSSSTMTIKIAPIGWELSEFKAGQYTVIGLQEKAPRSELADTEEESKNPDKWIRRAYSIASSSKEREFLEFYVSMVYSGSLTPRLFALEEGDEVWLSSKITGQFTLDQIDPKANIVFMATGTGLAPYMSMIRSNLADGRFDETQLAILHGARHSWDLGYRNELEALQRKYSHLHYFPVIDDPKDENVAWTGRVGFVQQLWEDGTIEKIWGTAVTPENTHVLLCGNPFMVEQSIDLVNKKYGLIEHSKDKPGQVHTEKYWV